MGPRNWEAGLEARPETRKLTRLMRISMAIKCIPGDSYVEGILVSCDNWELKIHLNDLVCQ